MTVSLSDEVAALARFRAARTRLVTSPHGALALVNTEWILREHGDVPQSVWGVPGAWAPRAPGESGLLLTATAADAIEVDGVPVDGTVVVRGRDDAHPSDLRFSDTISGFVIASEAGDYALRVWDAASDAMREFGSVDAYPYNPDWVVRATFTPVEGGRVRARPGQRGVPRTDSARRYLVLPGRRRLLPRSVLG